MGVRPVSGAGGGSADNAPHSYYLVPFGDSRSYQNWGWSTNTVPGTLARGFLFWAQALSQRVRVSSQYNQGVSGNTVSQLKTRLINNTPNSVGVGPRDIPAGAICTLHIGTNDIKGSTTKAAIDAILTDYDFVLNWLTGRGHRVIIITEWPRSDLTATEANLMAYYVETLRRKENKKNVWIVDVWREVVDLASATGAALTKMLDDDLLHNNPGVALATGRQIAKCLADMGLPKIQYSPSGNLDVYHATNNPKGCLNSNPMLVQGTGGTPGSGVTGLVPQGYNLNVSAGLSAVGSFVEIDVDGIKRSAFRVVVSGTPTTTSNYIQLRQSGLHTLISAGNQIQSGYEAYISAGAENFGSPGLFIDPGVSLERVHAGLMQTSDHGIPTKLQTGLYVAPRTPVYTVPSSVPGSFAIDIRGYSGDVNVPVSYTIDFLSAWIRKV